MAIYTNDKKMKVVIEVPVDEQSTLNFEEAVMALYHTYHKQGYTVTISLRG